MVNIRKNLLTSDVEDLLSACNFSTEEEQVFRLLVKNASVIQMTFALNMSQRTVERRVHDVKARVAEYWRRAGALGR
ncbi:MAG: hypothetical protein J6V15_02150 [Clostridia bacterium]|nr:hypothetical protein [Clostridia bacterium]